MKVANKFKHIAIYYVIQGIIFKKLDKKQSKKIK